MLIKSLVEWRKKAISKITIFTPAITIFIVYFTGINFADIISKFSQPLANELLSKPTLSFTINSAFVVVLISLLIEGLKYPGEFIVEVKNNSRKSDSYFDIRAGHNPVTVHMDCKFNFKNQLIHLIISCLGGIKLNCSFPHWVDYVIENKKDLKLDALKEEKNEFNLNIGQALQKNTIELPLYIKLSILSKSFEKNEGSIIPTFELVSESKFKKFILYSVMFLFFDIKTTNYKVESRSDI
ncbi:hypothetical protein [Neobacillus sp. PS3-40]|uniref:hypothetical protein n=1 Tax=Neobacillus sp. PS3-40 TaxID=3070679 RepID=UPI0027E13766|nr:hypothetical protein [Neobacillus sp. PS3-40]WML43133.1 hypothetical protein RCG20_15160 [Neobacillus sp. PS3-40]